MGYTGSANLLVRYLNQGRAEGDRPVTTPRHAGRLLLTDPENLRPKETTLLEKIAAACPEMTALYVFARPNGHPIEPGTLTRHFNALLRRVHLRQIQFHDLRHSTATLVLEQGVELVVIKELLGHAHIGVTATVYAHVRLRLRRQAIDLLSHALQPLPEPASEADDDPPLCAAPVS